MDQNTLIKRLMATFLEELEEHVAALNRDLLGLEEDPSLESRAERLRGLFRTAHSLKGAARAVSVELIERTCHCLEEILTAVRDEQLPLQAELFALLFATADGIEEAGMRLREQQHLSEAPLAELLPRLEAALRAPPHAGTPPPAPINRHESEPAATSITQVEPPPPAMNSPLPPETPPESNAGPATVRVAAEKLDAFLARNGELLVARRRVQSRAEDLDTLREFIARWKSEWQAVEKHIVDFFGASGAEALEEGGVQRPAPVRVPGRAGNPATRLSQRAAQVIGRIGPSLRHLEKDLETLTGAMLKDGRILKEAASAVDDEVRRVRLLPFAEACQGLDRMVRDLARTAGKEVDLIVEGGNTELDRSVLEGLKDPLRHLLRNAIDHGAERPEARLAAGKPRRMQLRVAAVLRGATVEVVVADDGRGIDLNSLRQMARKKHLPEAADDQDLAQLIFLPGLSTAPLITDVSGRGVGLDVVKSRVEALHGSVTLSFQANHGTRFTLAVPLTLTTLRVLMVTVTGQTYAFVGATVQQLVRASASQVRTIEGREMLALGGTPVPLASLAETLGLREPATPRGNDRFPVVVLAAGDKRLAFVVDEFLAEQEVVVKNLGSRIRRLQHASAATILPSGRIALVLNSASLVRSALQGRATRSVAAAGRTPAKVKKRILVVDDSVTTRTLEKTILEGAGYEVSVAIDGADGWRQLQERGADLLVSDVDMPKMDGFTLTQTIRASQRFRELPVVLVTSRESEQDRARGIEVQADAYLGKSGLDQTNLLETVAQLL